MNADRIVLIKEKVKGSIRFGFSKQSGKLGLPVGFNLFTGNRASHFVVSLVGMPYFLDKKGAHGSDDKYDEHLVLIPGLGYR